MPVVAGRSLRHRRDYFSAKQGAFFSKKQRAAAEACERQLALWWLRAWRILSTWVP